MKAQLSFGPGAFRLCLAGAVLLSHLSRFDYGRPAVMIFFMLSGYWVAKMQDGPHHLGYLSYMGSRMLRIWPQLCVAAVVAFTAYRLLGVHRPGSLLSTVALLGLDTRRDDLVGTVWSLDIETQFYLLLPMLLLGRDFFANRWNLVALTATAFGTGLAIQREWDIVTVLLYFPMFAAGFGVYLFNISYRPTTAAISILGGLAAISVLAVPGVGFHRPDQIYRDVEFMIAALLLIPFVAWNVRQPSPHADRVTGNLSYPLYLVHEPCVFITLAFVPGHIGKAIAIIMALTAAALLYAGIDRPVDKLRVALRKRIASSRTNIRPYAADAT